MQLISTRCLHINSLVLHVYCVSMGDVHTIIDSYTITTKISEASLAIPGIDLSYSPTDVIVRMKLNFWLTPVILHNHMTHALSDTTQTFGTCVTAISRARMMVAFDPVLMKRSSTTDSEWNIICSLYSSL